MENTSLQQEGATKNVDLNLSEALHSELRDYANITGNKLDVSIVDLIKKSLRIHKLSNGIITDASPDFLDKIRSIVNQVVASTPVNVIETEPQAVIIERNEDEVIFIANANTRALINRLNNARLERGLAPIEQSLCELLLQWCIGLGEYSSFKKASGENYDSFKTEIKALAHEERSRNGIPSNLIDTKGVFSASYDIIDTSKNS